MGSEDVRGNDGGNGQLQLEQCDGGGCWVYFHGGAESGTETTPKSVFEASSSFL
jgi:hypothetical protein